MSPFTPQGPARMYSGFVCSGQPSAQLRQKVLVMGNDENVNQSACYQGCDYYLNDS
jgi:hypothetical protein